MNNDELQKLENAAKNATPGSWTVFQDDHICNQYMVAEHVFKDGDNGEANCVYITAANPTAVLSLITANRKASVDVVKAQNVAIDIAMKLAKAKVALEEIEAGYHTNIQECMNIARAALKELE